MRLLYNLPFYVRAEMLNIVTYFHRKVTFHAEIFKEFDIWKRMRFKRKVVKVATDEYLLKGFTLMDCNECKDMQNY